MNILFTICGRAGSKGLKNKNIKDFLGIPLPYYTISAIELFLKQYGENFERADIVLNTDSDDLIKLIKAIKSNIFIIKRPEELSGDYVGKIDVIRHSVFYAEEHLNSIYDIIIDLDITSPLRTVTDIKKAIDKKIQSDVDVVFSVTDARRNPYFNLVTKIDNTYKTVIESEFVSRQQAPEMYDMNASIYVYSRSFIISKKKKYEKADIITMLDTGIIDIDSELDFELMQVIAKYLYNQNPEFSAVREGIKEIMNT